MNALVKLQRGYRLARLASMLAITITLAASARIAEPLFEIQPDPPSAGSDVQVTYYGNSDRMVTFEIGDGEVHRPKIAKDGTFKIPKALLKAGKKLRIRDGSHDEIREASVCFYIEP